MLPQQGLAASILSGNVSGTLDAANSPYRVTGNITVPSAQTLTLEAGVVIKFQTGTGLTVNGTLVSNGTSGDPVYLTSLADDSVGGDTANDGVTTGAAGQWTTVQFNNSTSATQLTQTIIRYGQSVNLSNSSPVFQGVVIGTMSSNALNLDLASFPSGTNNSAVGSPLNGANVPGGSYTQSGTWGLAGIPYVIQSGEVLVNSGVTLTVAPGAVIKSFSQNGSGSRLRSLGRLLAVGTAGQPIVFTSLRDDSVGGDTNQAEGAVSPVKGNVSELYLDGAGSTTSQLEHVVLRYAGGQNGTAVLLVNSAPTLRFCDIGLSSQDGIQLNGAGSTPLIDQCDIHDNNRYGIRSQDTNGGAFTLTNSTVARNANWGAFLNRATEISGNVFDTNSSGAVYLQGPGTTVLNSNSFTGNGSWMMQVGANQFLSGSGNVVGTGNSNAGILESGGTITTNGAWSLTDIPYLLRAGEVLVGGGVTLTIAPGVTVKSYSQDGSGSRLRVQGTLLAVGTPSQPITFTSARDDTAWGDSNLGEGGATPQRGNVSEIYLNGAGSSASRLENVVLRYAGGQNGPAVLLENSTATLKNCDISLSSQDGVMLSGAGSTPLIERCSIHDNNRYGIRSQDTSGGAFTLRSSTLSANSVWGAFLSRAAEITSSSFSANGNGLYIQGPGSTLFSSNYFSSNSGWMVQVGVDQYLAGSGNSVGPGNGNAGILQSGGTMTGDGTWGITEIPYLLRAGEFVVGSGRTLTIAPGVTVKSYSQDGSNSRIRAQGTLLAVGTQAQPITFTSARDDSAWGESNLSEGGATPQRGNVSEINLDGAGSSASRLENVILRYAGNTNGSAIFHNNSTATIRNCDISLSSQDGITLAGTGSTPLIEGCSIHDNNRYGIRSQDTSGGAFTLRNTSLARNSSWGAFLNRATEISSATFDANGNGLYIQGPGSTQLSSSAFTSNGGTMMQVGVEQFVSGGGNLVGAGNGSAGLLVSGGTMNTDGAWSFTDFPYLLRAGEVVLAANRTLTIAPGVTVKSYSQDGSNSRIRAQGTLLAIGTPSQRIVFTSARDDSAWGDSNLAEGGATAQRGNVSEINLDGSGSSASRLEYVTMRYAGNANGPSIYHNNSTATVRNCDISFSSQDGITLAGAGSAPLIDKCFIHDNNRYGIRSQDTSGGAFTLRSSTISGNSSWGAFLNRAAEVSQSSFSANANALYIQGPGSTILSSNYFSGNAGTMIQVGVEQFVSGAGNVAGPGNGSAGVLVSGGTMSSGDGAWTLTDFPYLLRAGEVVVGSGRTLTIAPGVFVKSYSQDGSNSRLRSQGTLLAVGAPGQPITFTSARDDSAWGDSNFAEGGATAQRGNVSEVFLDGAGSSASRLERVIMRYAGNANGPSVYLSNSTATIRGCDISLSSQDGVTLAGAGSTPVIDGCFIHDNNRYGIRSQDTSGGLLTLRNSTVSANLSWGAFLNRAAEISSNTFSSNANGLYIQGPGDTAFSSNTFAANSNWMVQIAANQYLTGSGNVVGAGNGNAGIQAAGGTITSGGAWSVTDMPYLLRTGEVVVSGGVNLTIAPGAVVKAYSRDGSNSRLRVQGTLTAVGTSTQPITFTSVRDDTVGGDSNFGNNPGGGAAPGDVSELYLDGTGSSGSRLEYVALSYGGNANGPDIYFLNSSATLKNSQVKLSSQYGILASGASAKPPILSTLVTQNPTGILTNNGAQPEVHGSNVQGNTSSGLQNNDGSVTVNAQNNYWGAANGPFNAAANPGGSGNQVSNNVNFTPFLTSPATTVPPQVLSAELRDPSPARPGAFVRYRVFFNKDMDPAFPPSITYGLSAPYDAQSMSGGAWITSTIYESSTTLPALADGSYSARVSGARDAAGETIAPSVQPFYAVDGTPPGAPSLLAADSQAAGAVQLAWQAPTGEAAASYSVYRATYEFASRAGLTPARTGLTAATVSDTPPEDGLYYYAVSALDAAGNEGAVSNRLSAASVRAAPSAPRDLTAFFNHPAGRVELAWLAPSTGTAASYRVYRSSALVATTTATARVDVPPADGNYSYYVTALDAVGNESEASTAAVTAFDVRAPVIVVAGISNGQHYRTDRVPTVTVTDFSAFTATATLNGEPFVSGTTVTAPGAYTLAVAAQDVYGSSSAAAVAFTIDKSSPQISIVSPSSGALLSQDTAVVFVATDDFTAGGQLVVRNQTNQAPPYSITAEGLQTLTLTATDLAGNASTASVTVTLDKTAPVAVTDLRVVDQREGEVDLAWTAPADAVSGVAAYDLRTATFSITAANFAAASALPAPAAQTAGTTVSTTVFTDTGVTRYFAVRSTDAAGHVSAVSNVAFLDRDGPALSGLSPAFASLVSRPRTVSVSASDLSGVERVVFYLDGVAVSTRSTPPYSFAWDTLAFADGEHALVVRAYDAGGRESVLSGLYNLLYAPPAAPTIASPSNGFATFSATVAVTGAAEPGTTAQVRLGGVAGATALVASNGTYSVNAVLPVEGDYQLTVIAKDAKGQSNPSAPVTVNYNVAPPNPPRDFSAETRPAGKVRLTWTVPPGKTPASYRLYRSPSDTALSSGTTPGSGLRVATGVSGTAFEDTPPSDGTFYYGATSVDSSGNESGLSEVSAGLSDRTPPSGALALGAAAVGVGQRPLTLTLTEPVASAPILLFVANGAGPLAVSLTPQSTTVWTGTLTVTAATNPGAASFQFQGTDFAGNAGTTLTSGQSVLVDNRGPVGSVTLYPFPPLPAGNADLALILDEAAASTPTLSFVTAHGSTIPVVLEAAGTAGTTWVGTVTVPSGQDGTAVFAYAASDALGNAGTTLASGGSFVIDATPPGAPLSLGATSRPAGVVRLAWSGPIGEPAAAYRVYRDSAALPGTVAPQGDQTGRFDDSPAEGAHVYQVASLDVAGNEGPLSNAASGLSDAAPPPAPAGASAVIDGLGRVNLSWDAQPGETYRVYRTTYAPPSLAGLSFTLVAASPVTDVPPQNGLIRYFLSALDGAGNVSTAAATATVFYDRAPPVISVSGVENNGLYNHGVFPAFSASDPALDTATVQGKLDGSPFVSGTLVASEGEHTLVVTAANLGGVGSTVTVHFALDLSSPAISVTGVAAGQTYHAAVVPVVNVTDPRLASVSVTLDGAAYTAGVPISADGVRSLVVTARDLAGNVASSTTTFTLDLPPAAPPSFTVAIEEGLGASLSWQSPGGDTAGYRAFRDGTPLHQGLLTEPRFSDPAYALGQARVYEVAAVDAAGQEGARAKASIPAVTAELESYGTVENGAPALTRGFFDALRVRLANASGSAKLVGPVTLDVIGGASASGQAASVSVPAGGQAVAEGVVAVPVGLPASASVRATVKLPVELGAQATMRRTFSVASRAPREPILEAFPEALVRGTNKNVRVKVNNQGSAPLELLSAVPSDLLVELRTPEGTTLSSARLSQSGAGAQPSPSGFFVSVPGGSSVLLDPVSIFVPDALGSEARLRVRLERVFNGLVSGPVTGPRDFETVKTLSGVAAPPYTASVSPQLALYDQGSSVILLGEARDGQAQLVPGATVQIGVSVRGFERVASTRTDETGHYQLTFSPAPAESGQYTLWAAHPEVVDRAPQAGFTIVGLSWQFSDYTATLTQNSTVPFRVNLTNVGQSRIEGLSATVVSSSVLAGAALTLDPASLPAVLEAGQSASVSLSATASAAAALGRSRFAVRVTESHGFVRELPVNADVAASAPVPSIEPAGFNVGMSAGQTRTLEVRLKNAGTRAWEGVFVTAPTLPWVRISGSSTLGDVPPGGSKSLFLVLEPPSSLPSQAFAANPLVELRSSNFTAIPVNALITLTASGLGNVAYTVINADKPRNQFGAGEGVPTSEVSLVSLDVSGLSFRATADSNGVVRLLNVPAGRYSYTAKAAGFEDASGVETIEPGVTLQKELLLLTNVVSYEWTVEPTTIQDQYNIQLGITFKTDVPAPVVVMEPAVMNFNLTDGQSTDAQLTVENKGLVSAFDVDLLPAGRDPAIVIDMPYARIPELKAGQKVVVPFRVTLIHASCHTEDMSAGYGYTCAAGTTVRKSAPPTKISAGDCFNLPTTSVGGGSTGGGGGGFGGGSSGSGGSGISLSVPASYVSYAIPNPPTPPAPPNSCRPPSEKYPSECTTCDQLGAYSDPGGDPRVPESDLSIAVPKFGGSLDFTRVYDSQDFDASVMGRAWTHSFDSRVRLTRAGTVFFRDRAAASIASVDYASAGGGVATIQLASDSPLFINADWLAEMRTPSGRRLLFRHTGGTGFSAPAGEPSTLVLQGSTAAPTGFLWTLPDKTVYAYDAAGKLLSIKDRNDNQVSLVYSGGLLTTIKDPDNRTLYTLSYSGGKLTGVTDLAGRSLSFSYDGSGYLSQSQGPKGSVSYGYTAYDVPELDAANFANGIFEAYKTLRLLTSIAAPNGHVTSFTYGPPSKRVDYALMEQYLTSDNKGSFTTGNAGFGSVVISEGRVTPPTSKSYYTPLLASGTGYIVDTEGFARWYFPQRFFTLSESGPLGAYSFAHTVDELLEGGSTVITDSRGFKETRYWENKKGRAQTSTVQDSGGGETKTAYDSNGYPAQVIDRSGRATNYIFDGAGNRTRATNALGQSTVLTYDSQFNQLTSRTDPRSNQLRFYYDSKGNLTRTENPQSQAVTFGYDTNGLLVSISAPQSNAISINRDGNGFATSITDSLNRTVSLTYDDLGRALSMTDGANKTTQFQYNSNGSLTQVKNAQNGIVKYDYINGLSDSGKQVERLTDQNNNATTFGYDSRGRLTSVTNAVNQIRTYQYDSANNLTQRTAASGAVITFEYDSLGRVTRKNIAGDPVSYSYDAAGNETVAENSASKIQTSYDALNRPIRSIQTNKTANLTSQIEYEYDASGNRSKLTLAASPAALSWTYSYDSANRLTSITTPQNKTTTFEYDSLGRQTRRTHANGTETTFAYNNASEPTAIIHRRLSGLVVISSAIYSYDSAGNPLTLQNAFGSHAYTYDDLHRLIGASHPPGSMLETETFSYDAAGNITSDIHGSGYTHDAANRLLSDASFTYTYDANGNLKTKTRISDGHQTSYTYDEEDRLTSVSEAGHSELYKYDPHGRRIERSVILGTSTTVTRYIYDGENLFAATDGNNTATLFITRHPRSPEILNLRSGASNYYFHSDGLASPVAISQEDGTLFERIEYQAYGAPSYFSIDASSSQASQLPISFGQSFNEWDTPSYLYKHPIRFRDPFSGRFLQEDPANHDGPNLYWYARANPTRFVDPRGATATGAWIGASLGLAGGAILGGGSGLIFGPTGAVVGIAWGSEMGAALGATAGAAIGNLLTSYPIHLPPATIFCARGNDPTSMPGSDPRGRLRNPVFRRWFHRVWKKDNIPGNRDATPEELEQAWEDWNNEGRPDAD